MKTFSIGKLLISLVTIYATVGSYVFDWNKTHIYNPAWPPHAKFHNAQAMLLDTIIGLTALWVLWSPKADGLYRLRLASALASYYWITQAGSLLFPGTALVDPQFAYPGQPPAQLIVDIVMLVLAIIGYLLASRQFTQNARLSASINESHSFVPPLLVMFENTEVAKPKIWKMLLIGWIFAFLVVNLIFALLGPYLSELHPLLVRSAVITTILVPTFGFGLPAIQRKLHQWTIN